MVARVVTSLIRRHEISWLEREFRGRHSDAVRGGRHRAVRRGKAARDALFLAELGITALPLMVVATAVVSIALVGVSSRALKYVAPGTFVPLAFAVSATLLFLEWGLAYARAQDRRADRLPAHLGPGPMLGSGFWLIATERFDPRTAKKRFGQIAGCRDARRSCGRSGAPSGSRPSSTSRRCCPSSRRSTSLCAWQVRRLAQPVDESGTIGASRSFRRSLAPAPGRSGLRVLARAPYLRNLAALVMLGTMGAALADYVFKAQAVAALRTRRRSPALLRHLLRSVERRHVPGADGRQPARAGAAGAGDHHGHAVAGALLRRHRRMARAGISSAMVARGGESVFRASLFAPGTSCSTHRFRSQEKRAAKSIIDVGFDRLGDALGGGAVRVVLLVAPATSVSSRSWPLPWLLRRRRSSPRAV